MIGSLDDVAVVVVNYGSSALLEQNLAPLTRAAPQLLAVVVDNRTDDAERERVTDLAAEHGWLLVPSATNLGFGAGMNLGVQHAIDQGAALLLLLNPDAVIAPSDVSVLADRARKTPLTMLAPEVRRPDGSVWFAGSDLYLHDGRLHSRARRSEHGDAPRQPWLSGACLMLTTRLWTAVGGFRDEYFLYWEDVDLSHRVLAVGGDLALCSDATAIHAEGGTHSAGREAGGASKAGQPKSELYYFFVIRNRLLFAALNLDRRQIRAWMRVTPAVAWEVLLQGGRRQLRSIRPWRAALRGVREGRRLARRALRAN